MSIYEQVRNFCTLPANLEAFENKVREETWHEIRVLCEDDPCSVADIIADFTIDGGATLRQNVQSNNDDKLSAALEYAQAQFELESVDELTFEQFEEWLKTPTTS